MNTLPVRQFEIGALYSHEQIYRSLQVGNAGGIRPAVNSDGTLRRLVIFTASTSAKIERENPYADRLEGDVLVYTAAGREGEQSLSGINSRIPSQLDARFPIYCFQNIAHRRSKT